MYPRNVIIYYLVPVAETVFVIPAKAGIQFFALDPCFRRGDIFDFRFPQQMLFKAQGFFEAEDDIHILNRLA